MVLAHRLYSLVDLQSELATIHLMEQHPRTAHHDVSTPRHAASNRQNYTNDSPHPGPPPKAQSSGQGSESSSASSAVFGVVATFSAIFSLAATFTPEPDNEPDAGFAGV